MKKLLVSLTALIFFSVGSVYAKSATLTVTGAKAGCNPTLYNKLKKLKIKVSGVENIKKGSNRPVSLKTSYGSGQYLNLQYVKRSGMYQYSSNSPTGGALLFAGRKDSAVILKKLVIKALPGCTDSPDHNCYGARMKFIVDGTNQKCTLLFKD